MPATIRIIAVAIFFIAFPACCILLLLLSDTSKLIEAIKSIITPIRATRPNNPCIYASGFKLPMILTVAAINARATPILISVVFNPLNLSVLLLPSNSTAESVSLLIATANPTSITANTPIAPTVDHNFLVSIFDIINTAADNAKSANARLRTPSVFFSNADALRFLPIALAVFLTDSSSVSINSPTLAIGAVIFLNVSIRFFVMASIPTPAPTDITLVNASPTLISLNLVIIFVPMSFIASHTVDAVFSIPLTNPATTNSPSASISLDGEAILSTFSNADNSFKPISFSISGIMVNPDDKPFLRPSTTNPPASFRSISFIISTNF